MRLSIIIPSYKRSDLLKWNLFSLKNQHIPFDFEVVVLNDGVLDGTEELCSIYKDDLNIKYFFTGHRNLNTTSVWRIPGFAINIGVRKSEGEIILICCAEMFHINDTVKLITDIYDNTDSDKVIAIPKAKDDRGGFLRNLIKSKGNFDINNYYKQPPLDNVRFPFLMAMKKKEFENIGGYDEDFLGIDYDDVDFVERLLDNGCYYVETDALTIHLWHQRVVLDQSTVPRITYNRELYFKRKGNVIRNVGREWGTLN